MAFKRSTEGYDYETEKRFEFLNKMAEHDGAGAGLSAEMLQMGAGLGMMGAVGGMMQETMSQSMTTMSGAVAAPVPTPVPASASVPAPAQEDPLEVLKKLKALLDAGLIEQSEYDAKKVEVLSRL